MSEDDKRAKIIDLIPSLIEGLTKIREEAKSEEFTQYITSVIDEILTTPSKLPLILTVVIETLKTEPPNSEKIEAIKFLQDELQKIQKPTTTESSNTIIKDIKNKINTIYKTTKRSLIHSLLAQLLENLATEGVNPLRVVMEHILRWERNYPGDEEIIGMVFNLKTEDIAEVLGAQEAGFGDEDEDEGDEEKGVCKPTPIATSMSKIPKEQKYEIKPTLSLSHGLYSDPPSFDNQAKKFKEQLPTLIQQGVSDVTSEFIKVCRDWLEDAVKQFNQSKNQLEMLLKKNFQINSAVLLDMSLLLYRENLSNNASNIKEFLAWLNWNLSKLEIELNHLQKYTDSNFCYPFYVSDDKRQKQTEEQELPRLADHIFSDDMLEFRKDIDRIFFLLLSANADQLSKLSNQLEARIIEFLETNQTQTSPMIEMLILLCKRLEKETMSRTATMETNAIFNQLLKILNQANQSQSINSSSSSSSSTASSSSFSPFWSDSSCRSSSTSMTTSSSSSSNSSSSSSATLPSNSSS
jgi:hypothetical protein